MARRRDGRLSQCWADASAQDMTEYALLAALISIMMIPAVTAFGNPVAKMWSVIQGVLAAI